MSKFFKQLLLDAKVRFALFNTSRALNKVEKAVNSGDVKAVDAAVKAVAKANRQHEKALNAFDKNL